MPRMLPAQIFQLRPPVRLVTLSTGEAAPPLRGGGGDHRQNAADNRQRHADCHKGFRGYAPTTAHRRSAMAGFRVFAPMAIAPK